MEMIKVISIVSEHEFGNLWFGVADKDTPQRLFDYITTNCESGEPYEIMLGEVSKEDFDKQD